MRSREVVKSFITDKTLVSLFGNKNKWITKISKNKSVRSKKPIHYRLNIKIYIIQWRL